MIRFHQGAVRRPLSSIQAARVRAHLSCGGKQSRLLAALVVLAQVDLHGVHALLLVCRGILWR